MPNKPQYNLKKYLVKEISFVPEGAVLEDYILLKNKEGNMPTEKNLLSKIEKEELEAKEAEAKVEAAKVEAEKVEAEAKVEAEKVEAEKAKNKSELEIEKSKRVELEKRLETLEVEKSKEIFKAKAEKLKSILTSDNDLAEVLRECNDKLEKSTFEKLEKTLVAANEAIKTGSLFKEIGTEQSDDSADDFEKLEKLARANSEKNGTTYEREYVVLINKNKGLYK